LSLSVLAATAASAGAFTVGPRAASFARTSVSLEASRSRDKVASRSKWAESRGYMSSAATADAAESVAAGLMTNDEGLEYVRLANANGDTADVYLYGGVVTSYVAGGVDYIAVRPDAKMDGSKPISGGLSHCWPQFGPGEIQQHGFARNVNWTVKDMSDTAVTLEMAPSDYTKEMWDKEFLCTFSVDLEADKLATRMFVENNGEEAFSFQSALHSYFTVSAIENLSIAGSFTGKEFLNKMVGDGARCRRRTGRRSPSRRSTTAFTWASTTRSSRTRALGRSSRWPTLRVTKTLSSGTPTATRAWDTTTSCVLRV